MSRQFGWFIHSFCWIDESNVRLHNIEIWEVEKKINSEHTSYPYFNL